MGEIGKGLRLLEPAPPTGRRGAAARRIVPWLVGGIVLVAVSYGDVADGARRARPAERLVEEVALLSSVLAIAAEDLLSQERAADLDQLLGAALEADEVVAAFVLGPAGLMLAGGAVDETCLPGELPLRLSGEQLKGTADCGSVVQWSATLLGPENRWLIVGIEDVKRSRGAGDELRRQLWLLVIALAVIAASAFTIFPALQEVARGERAM